MGNFKAQLNNRDSVVVDIFTIERLSLRRIRTIVWMSVYLDFFAETLTDRTTYERLEEGEEIEFSISEVTRE